MSKTLCCRHYQLASCPSGSKWPHRAFPKVAARIETWRWGVMMWLRMMLMATILSVSCLVFARNMIKIKISTTCYTLSSKSTRLVLCTVLILYLALTIFCYSDHMHWARKVARAQKKIFLPVLYNVHALSLEARGDVLTDYRIDQELTWQTAARMHNIASS